MLYFAYGSNLECAQIRNRCPTARFICRAVLKDHRVAITRKRNAGTGTADVISATGKRSWGIVYEIDACDIPSLDASEGYRPGRATNSYIRHDDRVVEMEDNPSRPVTVSIYIAVRQPNPPPPAPDYKAKIVDGARFWNFPMEYVTELEATL